MSATVPILDPQRPPARLALAYAAVADRPLWAAYFALEARLAEAGSRISQPIIAQLRLAWWRDRFKSPAPSWPQSEPLLAALAGWDDERETLVALVDAWETLLLGDDDGQALAEARVGAMQALGRLTASGAEPSIEAMARDWQAPQAAGPAAPLPRAMRPVAILRALAIRDARGRGGVVARLGDIAALTRLALLGR